MTIWLGNQRLDGLTKGALSYNNISNCITEIPQDIKLEINVSGQLVVKAGSKAYVPNGVGTFTQVTITTDQIWTADSYNHDEVFFIKLDGTLARQNTDMLSSGATNVMGDTSTYCHCYNTTDNKIYRTTNGGSTWTETGESLPIALVTKNNSKFVQIKQVFNGFGYIGSTVFALPGVKGLIPDGRNEDGSLKNIEISLSSVKTTQTNFDMGRQNTFYIKSDKSLGHIGSDFFLESKYIPPFKQYAKSYVSSENKLYYGTIGGTTWSPATELYFKCGKYDCDSAGKITSFDLNNAFHALDYNDTEYIAHQAMPSDRYIELSITGSSTTLMAPADGYVVVGGYNSNAPIARIALQNNTTGFCVLSNAGQGDFGVITYLPVRKGDTYTCSAANIDSWSVRRFYYLQGSK